MGISSDGLLVFGFPIGEEDENPLPNLLGDGEDFEDFEDFIADEAGIGQWSDYFTDEQSSHYLAKKCEVVAACPVDLVRHCSYEYPMYFLAVRGTDRSASRGSPEEISLESMAVAPEKIEAAKQWCVEHNIEWQEPKWYLASLYG